MTQPSQDRSERPLTPAEQIRKAYETTERATSKSMEDLVSSEGFSEMLSMFVGNAMSLTKMTGTALDDAVRRTHLAGRSDLTRLGRQLARTEDKIELLLQHIERLEDEVAALRKDLASRDDASGDAGTKAAE